MLKINLRHLVLSSFFLSLFWVVFLWSFFEKGGPALGWNLFVFVLLFFVLSLFWARGRSVSLKENLFWIIPLFLIILSFFIYENPVLKFISLFLVFPLFFSFFYNFSFLKDSKNIHFSDKLISYIFFRVFSLKVREVFSVLSSFFEGKKEDKKSMVKRVFVALIFLFVVLFFIIVPLFSSFDPVFSDKFSIFYSYLESLISSKLFFKLVFLIFMTIAIATFLISWSFESFYKEKEIKNKEVDPVIAGIFLGGVLFVYLFFLWIQAYRLFTFSLPVDFSNVESFVKSGFWQLFFLSILNVLIYVVIYKKSNKLVQKILFAFTLASLLLLFSAGQRMYLYVLNYGLSYEKLFASYTIIFSAILFFWLLFRFFSEKRKDILKFMAILFLWMYSFLVVFPTEYAIFKTNIYLKDNVENSKIRLGEMRMLSSDVLLLAKKAKEKGILNEKSKNINNYLYNQEVFWNDWINKKEREILSKKWYERNISNIIFLMNN